MQQLPPALSAMAAFKQFILYKLVASKKPGKMDKIPINPHTYVPFVKGLNWQEDPSMWVDSARACADAEMLGEAYGVGFFLTPGDPFFCVDLDNCATEAGGWNETAISIMTGLPGAAIEVSQSGTGLHIWGSGTVPDHACKNTPLGLELYTERRFIALTGKCGTSGTAGADLSEHVGAVVAHYFPKVTEAGKLGGEWTDEPVDGYTSTESDEALIRRAIDTKGAAAAFGGITFEDLWTGNAEKLAEKWPAPDSPTGYDQSSADASLCQHLAFWTGGNAERINTLMWQSALVRDKWDTHAGYIPNFTIPSALQKQTKFYSVVENEPEGLAPIRGNSEAQNIFAKQARALIMQAATAEQFDTLKRKTAAKFWIDNKDKTPEQLVVDVSPMAAPVEATATGPILTSGYQLMTIDLQLEKFRGYAYVISDHKVWGPDGRFLNSDRFNAVHGGYEYQMDGQGQKTSGNAWDVFLKSQAIRWPRVDTALFDPREDSGKVFERDGLTLINTYTPINTPRKAGDASIFLEHLSKLLPDARDRDTLTSYMAACVQYQGHKFEWAPLIQGVEGNGKSTIAEIMELCIGRRYCHRPKSADLDNKFNAWMMGNIFINVEDIFAADNKTDIMEVLKPMITSRFIEIQPKGKDQETREVCGNFMFTCNGKDNLKKNRNDRRIAPFFTAQQDVSDLARDGMDEAYFARLYDWLRGADGYAIIHDYLATYPITAERNPCKAAGGRAIRAPITSYTDEAIKEGLGGAEQEVLEAIAEDRVGFRGGWISSHHLDLLLKECRKANQVPPNKRRAFLKNLGYVIHPNLTNEGRISRALPCDGNVRSRLFIKADSLLQNIKRVDVPDAYLREQSASQGVSAVEKAFNQ